MGYQISLIKHSNYFELLQKRKKRRAEARPNKRIDKPRLLAGYNPNDRHCAEDHARAENER